MTDVDELLPEAFGDLSRRAPHDPDLAGSVRRRARRQTRRRAAVAASVAGVLAVTGLSVALVRGEARPAPAAAPAAVPDRALVRCRPDFGVLPEWARDGFSDPEPEIAHVLGDRGDIVAIVFAQPLLAPRAREGQNNKILWVGRVAGSGDLVIDASLPGTRQRVRHVVPAGPGPSTIDVPVPGCWRFDLRWGQYSDTLYLGYATQ